MGNGNEDMAVGHKGLPCIWRLAIRVWEGGKPLGFLKSLITSLPLITSNPLIPKPHYPYSYLNATTLPKNMEALQDLLPLPVIRQII
jgi:hypothetical protein